MKSLTLLEKILAFLNLTEGDKVQSFLERQVKSLKRDEKNLSKNIDTLLDDKVDELEAISDKIADAEEAVEIAYKSVTPEDVNTNDKADRFAPTYWSRIEKTELEVMRLNAYYKQAEETFDKGIESLEEQLKETQRRLVVIA